MFKIMAAANFKPSKILPLLFILFIISSLPTTFSQSSSPQNIQTFYPFSPPPLLPPPPPVDDPFSVLPPPTTPTQPLQPPSRSSTRTAVGRAIGITAASTLVLSALLFFILLQRSRRKRVRDSTAIAPNGVNNNNNNNSSNITPVLRPQSDNFVRLEGNVKGVIVDENGLDVLYWRKLEEGDNINNRSSFKKQEYKKLKDEQKNEEEKRVVSGKGKRFEFDPPVQQVPLLRGKSSTSQSPVWGDNKQDFEIQKQPTLSAGTGRQDSSVQLVKMSTPPLPPPPGPPPPPPPPRMTVEAVAKAKPPPKGPSPPPPPPPNAAAVPRPPKGKRSASAGEGESSKGSSSKVQLKPLHWDKVNPNVEHSMVWDKLDKGSFKFDGDLMEALFGSVATNRKSPQKDTREDKQGPPSQIFILDTRKSQNTAIVLKSIGVSRKEIIDTLIQGRGLNPDTIEKLAKIGPTDEETSQILSFDGDPTRLADAESFLYHLLKAVPSAFIRFNAMLFRSSYDSEVSQIKESLKSLESGCNELRTRGLFLKLLEAILKAGNRLNAGTSRGNAQAFNLTALRKLSDVKSSDGKTTLLQFVVQEVVRAEGKRCVLNRNHSLSRRSSQSSDNSISKEDREKEYMMLGLPVIGGLSVEFSNVKKAAALDYDVLVKMSSALEVQVAEMRKLVAREDGGFARELNGFLDTAELEMRVVNEEQTRVMALVKKTTDYYQAGTWKDKGANPLHLFVMVRDFLGMVDKVCIEIARDVQSRKTVASYVASGSSSPESPRVFRFPKLPANFMSDSSKSSSSDSDDESSVR